MNHGPSVSGNRFDRNTSDAYDEFEDAMNLSLTGLGETQPLLVAAGRPAAFRRGRAICAEEIRLIDAEIARMNIPAPKRIPAQRPHFVMRAAPSGVRAAQSPSAVFDDAPDHPQSWWSCIPVLRRKVLRHWYNRMADAAAMTATFARPGEIVVVGERLPTIAAWMRVKASGRACSEVVPYGADLPANRSSLGRPKRGSFFHWLLARRGDLAGVGGVLFVGARSFEEEIAALADAPDAPPVVAARIQASGHVSTSEVLRPTAPSGPLPRISIVTVSFNQADYLEAAIRSVLDQDYPDLEYIIVDGGSTDGSVDIIERYRSRLAHAIIESDNGQSDALNKGFARASGEILNWLCSDDMIEPGALWRIGDAYRRHRADLIVGGCVRIGGSRSDERYLHFPALPLGRTVPLDPYDILRFMGSWQKGNYFFQPETFFSRRIWETSGAYLKPHLFYAMDYDLWLRMALAGARVRMIPALIGCSRVHNQQKTQDDKVYLHQLRQMMEEYDEMFKCCEEAAPNRGLKS